MHISQYTDCVRHSPASLWLGHPSRFKENMAGRGLWRCMVHLLVERGQLMERRIRSTGIYLLSCTKLNQSQRVNVFITEYHKMTAPETVFFTSGIEHFRSSWHHCSCCDMQTTMLPFFLSPCFSSGLYTGHKHGWHFLVNVHKHCSVRGPLPWNSGELNFHDPPHSSNLHHHHPFASYLSSLRRRLWIT